MTPGRSSSTATSRTQAAICASSSHRVSTVTHPAEVSCCYNCTRRAIVASTNSASEERVMAHVSIIGTGNMGSAISALATKGGHTVEAFNSADGDKPVTGEVVVLAVPYPAVADVLAKRGAQLDG